MGVAEHKRRKNEACSRGLLERYGAEDYAGVRIDAEAKIVSVPKPGGRRARADAVDQPGGHRLLQGPPGADDAQRGGRLAAPAGAPGVRARPSHPLAAAAVAAGAPDGCLQVVEEPTIPLIEALMADEGVDVIVATGGTAVVRAAYRSGNPSLGVGPGNVPALVDATRRRRGRRALPGRLEGVRQLDPVHERVGGDRRGARGRRVHARAGAPRRARARRRGRRSGCARRSIRTATSTTALAGKDAAALADAAGVRVPGGTRVLVAPFPLIVPEEPLALEKLFPLLGLVRVPDAGGGSPPRARCCGSAAAATPRSSTRATRARSWPTAPR